MKKVILIIFIVLIAFLVVKSIGSKRKDIEPVSESTYEYSEQESEITNELEQAASNETFRRSSLAAPIMSGM